MYISNKYIIFESSATTTPVTMYTVRNDNGQIIHVHVFFVVFKILNSGTM